MSELNPLNVTYTDDPRVLIEQSAEDYSRHVVPLSARTNRWSLAMASWSVLSAMFYLYISVAVAQSVGSKNAIVGIVLSALFYGGINYVISQRSIKNGLTVALLSRGIFGGAGAIISSLLFAVVTTVISIPRGRSIES